MNSRTGLFAGGWAVTCAAAFFAGRTSEAPDSITTDTVEQGPAVSSSRGNDRPLGESQR